MKQTYLYSGRERREPKLTQRDYLHLKYLANLLKENVQRLLSEKDLLILDCGCGNKPYFPFFEQISSSYIGIDIRMTKCVDVIGDIGKLPFRDCLFDVVLSTQVLQYMLSPSTVIDEIYRVIKDDGFLFLSTHGTSPVDSFDFWRWTDLGLRRMLAKFSIVKIYECGGSIASLFQIINFYVPQIPFASLISVFLNKIGECLDNRFRGKVSIKLIVNYLAVARK